MDLNSVARYRSWVLLAPSHEEPPSPHASREDGNDLDPRFDKFRPL